MNYPHLPHRKESTSKIVDTVQRALELERSQTNPNGFKNKQVDVVDSLIELGAKHRSISNLLKRFNLSLPKES